jgi:signal transduction histidine kinase
MVHFPRTETRSTPLSVAIYSPEAQEFPTISAELQTVLQRIVEDVVISLDCVGVMVAPLEINNSLPIRAYSVDRVEPELITKLEELLDLTFISPRSVVYLDNKRFKDNLGVRAVKSHKVLVSDRLYDLFRPIVDEPLSRLAQQETGIKEVIAVPFQIGDEVVGSLFATSRQEFSQRDINFLMAFGNQAAIAIRTQRYLTEMQALERVILSLQASIMDETQVLQIIVDTVVQKLGYVGAMVATLEANNSLPVRAYSVGFSDTLLRQLESKLGVSFIGPRSVAYLDDERYKDNLSVRAVKGADGRPQKILTSDTLYDLFRPVVNRPLSLLAQKLTGINQVVAVPFFLEDEVVGNLFVASRKPKFSEREKEILTTFAQQAAVGIRNARLYRKAEERRQMAQIFGKMAFSAAASVHALRNHVGVVRSYLQLIEMGELLPAEKRLELHQSTPEALTRLNEAVGILDNLHEPWRQTPDIPANVNECLILAVRKVFSRLILNMSQPEINTGVGIMIYKSLSDQLPLIKTSLDMLTEAFRVVVKNAVEALKKDALDNKIWIESRLGTDGNSLISIRDNGAGIKPENLSKIFEMGWSTKEGQGMGFGLFWARDYIEGLGGSITVESNWGRGATFIISLPASQPQEDS